MYNTDNQNRSKLAKLLANVEKEIGLFKTEFRTWPFIIWLILGLTAGTFSILLPPAPQSHHFIDPSLKQLIVTMMVLVMTIWQFYKIAKR